MGADATATVTDFGLDRDGLNAARELMNEPRLRLFTAMDSLNVTEADCRTPLRTQLAAPKEAYSEAVNRAVFRAWQARFPGTVL